MSKPSAQRGRKSPGVEKTEASDEQFESAFLRDFPHFTANREDVRALAAVRRRLNLGKYEDMNIFVLMHNKDVSADRVFASDEENNIVFYSKRGSTMRALEMRGHEAKKANLEQHAENERADVFIALDPNLSVTTRLRQNIIPGGYVLCRLPAANALRPYGYRFRAVVTMGSGTPTLSRHNDPTFWKSAQVGSDKELREAGSAEGEGVVTYEYAKQKVHEAKEAGVPEMSEADVFGSYSKLIHKAERENPGAVAQGETTLSFSIIVDESEAMISGINTVLPTKKIGHYEDIVVMKRGPI